MKLTLGIVIAILCANLSQAYSQTSSGVTAITKETTKSQSDEKKIAIVWWIPTEFWEKVYQNNPRVNPAQSSEIIQTLKEYTLVVIIDGKKGGLAGITYTPADDLRKDLTLTNPDGSTLAPLAEDALNPAMKNLIGMMKPLLSNMLGQMGQNYNFFVFPGKDKAGKQLIDAHGNGKLTVHYSGGSFVWHLPLGSLMPIKKCDTCGEEFIGNYNFCPYDGQKLH